jgi:alpha-D-ribose 1-methylphosphonate 5-triphosphate synthase subunit PhnI
MSSLVQNPQIGTKLAIASAFGIVLVVAMIVSQLIGNGNVHDSNQAALAQQQLARDTVEAKLGRRSMQLAVRDIRLANNQGELQKAGEALLDRAKALNGATDSMLKLAHFAENRARMEKLKSLSADHVKGAQQNAAIRGEAFALTATDPARAAKITAWSAS